MACGCCGACCGRHPEDLPFELRCDVTSGSFSYCVTMRRPNPDACGYQIYPTGALCGSPCNPAIGWSVNLDTKTISWSDAAGGHSETLQSCNPVMHSFTFTTSACHRAICAVGTTGSVTITEGSC